MLRPILAALVVLFGCTAAVQAQTAVLYGLVDAAAVRARPVGGDWRWQLDSGAMSRSFIGFRGSEDLGGGLRAVFRLESYLRADSGQSGAVDGQGFFGRDANIGLSGQFGTTVLGRSVTPLFQATTNFNPFGESFGFSPSIRQWYGPGGVVLGDRSWNNSMSYTNSGRDAPLRVNLAANLPENTAGSEEAGRNFGASVAYITGPFAATVAAERIKNSPLGLPAGFHRQIALQAGATYDFRLLRLYGQIGQVRTRATTSVRTTLWQLGAAVPFGTSLVLVSYGHSHSKSDLLGTTDRIASIAYDYFLSRNTDIYVAASYEKTSFVSPSGAAFAGGIRHRF